MRGQISDSDMRQIIFEHQGNQSPRENRNLYSERTITYERVNCHHSGIHPGVRYRCVARRQLR